MDDNLSVEPNSYVFFQLRCLQLLGLWPLDTTNHCKLLCYYLYRMLVIIIIAVVSISQIIQIGFVPTIEEMSSTVDTATLNTAGLYMILYYIIYHEHFKSLIRRFDSKFVEHSIWDRKFKMTDYLRNVKFYTLFYIVSTWIALIIWTVVPLIDKNVFPTHITNTTPENGLYLNGTKNVLNKPSCNNILEIVEKFNYTNVITKNKYVGNTLVGNQTQTNVSNCNTIINKETFISETDLDNSLELIEGNRKFPVNSWFPFDTQSSPIYETIFILEISDLTFISISYILTDSFFFFMIYLVCGQLEIIKISLQAMRRLEEEFINDVIFEVNTENQGRKYKLSTESLAQQTLVLTGSSVYIDLEKSMYSVLTSCTQHHKMILEFLQDLEVLYRPLIFGDVLHAIVSLSFSIFRTSITANIFDYVKSIMFVAVCILHQFLNNYFSEILIYQQTSICETLYDTPWEDRSEAFKHTALLMMMRSRKPVQLNGCKMYFLCLNTFKEFVSTLISYIMVLRQLQSNNRK